MTNEEIAIKIVMEYVDTDFCSPDLIKAITTALDARTLVLPKRKNVRDYSSDTIPYAQHLWWNLCLDAVIAYNPWSKPA